MNVYSRALRHISIKDVKQKHQEKIVEKIQEEVRKKEERQYIQSVMETKKYDWRKELNEGMTSSGMFFTTLPATGEVDLNSISATSSGSFTIMSGTSVQSGGFSDGNTYLLFNGIPTNNYRYADSKVVDTTTYDKVIVSAISGSYLNNGGTQASHDLEVIWFDNDDPYSYGTLGYVAKGGTYTNEYAFDLPPAARGKNIGISFIEQATEQWKYYSGRSIPSIHPSAILDIPAQTINHYLTTYPSLTDAQKWDFGLSVWGNLQQYYYYLNTGIFSSTAWMANSAGYPAPVSGSTSSTSQADSIAVAQAIINQFGNGASTRWPLTYGISNISFQRRAPLNVFVPLDSPEAASFIRTDPIMSNLSPAERLKKLQEMLKASDKYVETKLGKNFPGSGAVPPGEYDPFKQAPAGKAGDTPGVQVTDYESDLTPLSKTPYGTGEVGQIAGGPAEYGTNINYGTRPDGTLGKVGQNPTGGSVPANMRYDPHMKIMVPNIKPGFSGGV